MDRQKTNNKIGDLNSNILVISVNVNDVNMPSK